MVRLHRPFGTVDVDVDVDVAFDVAVAVAARFPHAYNRAGTNFDLGTYI